MDRGYLLRRLLLASSVIFASGPILPYEGLPQGVYPPGDRAGLTVERFPIGDDSPLALHGPARPGEYLGAVGPQAAWLGFETGEGEVWAHPLKIARGIRLAFKIPQYSEPIPAQNVARRVDARPEIHTITYSHGAFLVKQHILAPRDLPGILLLLEVDAVVDLEIRVEFQPVLQDAWPGGFGGQYLFWDTGNRTFVLSESRRQRNAVIGSPWATEASAHPAHRLADAPSTFMIPVDRRRAAAELIPIAIAGGKKPPDEVLGIYRTLIREARTLYSANAAWARNLRSTTTRIQGGRIRPGGTGEASLRHDPSFPFTRSLEWAKVNLEEQRVCNPDLGCGLVAGWGPSGTSLRPGFGWFFGGDAAINSLALDATGQWDLAAEGLRLLASHQREDGKIPHEISQSAGTIPWFDEFPYAYYHADTTPFWMLALWYYWTASGDEALVRELWPAFRRAYAWCLSVETDGDGIIENTTGGLGAIEVGGLGEGIHQDIYLAAIWLRALEGAAEMALRMGEPDLAEQARELFRIGSETLNQGYWRPQEGHLAFGILRDGSTNDNLTAWPGTALAFGLIEAGRAEATLQRLASEAISSRWGARLLSTESELYDPLHYNNGAVWPFMTGFLTWAQYRYRRPWAGFPLLEALEGLNDDFALGRHPENLSGAYYQTMDATVPHQFFASSMLVTPLLRGMLGWEPNAPEARATLAPQPPPHWSSFSVRNLHVGGSRIHLSYERRRGSAAVALSVDGDPVTLRYVQAIPLGASAIRMETNTRGGAGRPTSGRHDQIQESTFLLREGEAVELLFSWEGGLEVFPPGGPLTLGSRSGGLRILDFAREGEGWLLSMEGDGGTRLELLLHGSPVISREAGVVPVAGLEGTTRLLVEFPGTGRVRRTVRLLPAG